MEYTMIGTSDLRVSKISLGTWQFGTEGWGFGADFTEDEALATVDKALSLGINLLDTAEVYGDGRSEKIVGKAIKDRRGKVILATKVLPRHLRKRDLIRACDESLQRLGIEQIDLYQIHAAEPYVPLKESMVALEKLIAQGKVRYVGVSNFSVPLLRAAEEVFSGRIVSNQVRYNLLQRGIEAEILPYCRERGITVIAYSPLAQGLLTGKYDRNHIPADKIRQRNPLFREENLVQVFPVIDLLQEIGKVHGVTTAQVALRWVTAQDGVIAIPGAKRPEQVEENAGALNWSPSPKELDRLNAASTDLAAAETSSPRHPTELTSRPRTSYPGDCNTPQAVSPIGRPPPQRCAGIRGIPLFPDHPWQ
jgi:aryl-alcohol dehydrogenase-like predicted oxidoreductase